MKVAIIPARGGSKRIPQKNIRPFHGRPMIEYSIRAALGSRLFDRVIVTTDATEIARIAVAAGAESPFPRPADLSDDHTPTAPVVRHVIDRLVAEGAEVEYALCLYATAPFVRPEDLRASFQAMTAKGASGCFAITSFPFPIFRALKIDDSGHLRMFWPEHELTRSNDLPAAYHDAGQFYWLRVADFLTTGKMWAPDAVPHYVPRHRCQDIDTPEDWETAERLYQLEEQRETR